jgi:hypothetical protein
MISAAFFILSFSGRFLSTVIILVSTIEIPSFYFNLLILFIGEDDGPLPEVRPVIFKFGAALRRGSRAIRHPAECPSARFLRAAPAPFASNLRMTTV